MTRYLKKWLTDKALEEQHDSEYEGVVAQVSEEMIRNRFTAQRETLPVVTFDDGWRLVLNKTFLQKFITWFGADSDNWVGRRVRVYRRQAELTNAKGVTRTKWVRDVVCEDHLARAPVPRAVVAAPTWTTEADDAFEVESFEPKQRRGGRG